MARSINNPVMQGATGRVGKITFRRTVFGTVIANMPDYDTKKEPTEDQAAFRQRFKKGTTFIKTKIDGDPLFKERYASMAKPGISAYTTAMADYMGVPKVNTVDVGSYNGQVGDTITIDATDNFGVETVSVAILNQSGELIETGFATFGDASPDWIYTAQSENGAVVGSKIEVRATDYTGATTLKELIIE